jgi:solute carrier family 25 (mitochondrial 2-oxodicarboxylate transporter), member 21
MGSSDLVRLARAEHPPRRFSRLYRGITAPILMEAPKRATKFAANDKWGQFWRSAFGQQKMTQSLSVLTGASAGATEAFIVVPFELVKIVSCFLSRRE